MLQVNWIYFRGNSGVDCRNNTIRKVDSSIIFPVEEDRNKSLKILEKDMKKLLFMPELCDFKIKVGDKNFTVQKALLKARCPLILPLLNGKSYH
jgi:hypothetical protein